MKRQIFLALMLVFGIAVGLIAAYGSQPQQSYCDKIEQQIQQNRNFSGTLACYPPGVIDVNLSDQVKNSSELRCVCRNVRNDSVQIFPITFSR